MRRTRTRWSGALSAIALAGGLWGCASGPDSAAPDKPIAQAHDPAPEPVDPPVGPSARAPEPAESAAPTGAPAPTIAASDAPNRAQQPTRGWRRDGRPVWWLDEPRRDATRLALSAEALGADVRSARRNAVAAGRAALAARLGAKGADAQVLAAVVRPIGAAEASPSAAKYVGFVLVAAALSDGDADPPR